jgi:hypothetical protein
LAIETSVITTIDWNIVKASISTVNFEEDDASSTFYYHKDTKEMAGSLGAVR